MSKLKSRVVVTGGARGQERDKAVHLANSGARVVAVDVLEPSEPFPPGIIFKKLDVTRREEWVALGDALKAEYGNVFGLVNNDGIAGSRSAAGCLENVALWTGISFLGSTSRLFFRKRGWQ